MMIMGGDTSGNNDAMIAVVSQAFTADSGAAARGYLSGLEAFGEFHEAQPGFRGRLVIRSLTDDTHFTNIRFFDEVSDYEAMIRREGYAEHINGLAQHLRPHEDAPGKDYAEVVLEDWPGEPRRSADPDAPADR
jgi:hypothetical protein